MIKADIRRHSLLRLEPPVKHIIARTIQNLIHAQVQLVGGVYPSIPSHICSYINYNNQHILKSLR